MSHRTGNSAAVWALIDESGTVIALVPLERKPDAVQLVPARGAQIGWTYGAGVFSEPPADEVPW